MAAYGLGSYEPKTTRFIVQSALLLDLGCWASAYASTLCHFLAFLYLTVTTGCQDTYYERHRFGGQAGAA